MAFTFFLRYANLDLDLRRKFDPKNIIYVVIGTYQSPTIIDSPKKRQNHSTLLLKWPGRSLRVLQSRLPPVNIYHRSKELLRVQWEPKGCPGAELALATRLQFSLKPFLLFGSDMNLKANDALKLYTTVPSTKLQKRKVLVPDTREPVHVETKLCRGRNNGWNWYFLN